MIDINLIRSNPEVLDQALARRGEKPRADIILTLDNKKRSVINEMQILQQRRNDLSQKIGSIFKSKDDKRDQGRLKSEVERLKNEVGELKNKIASLKDQAEALEGEFIEIMSIIPNIPLPDVPEGRDEADNVEIKRTGHKRELNFTPRQHFEIGEALGLMDFSQTAKISGARFVTLNGALARLSRALGQYMLDTHTEKHGYTEVTPPLLVRRDAMFGTGQLPKFQDDQFVTGDGLWLIPTAEVVLTNLWRESIIDVEQLPLRVTALTNCFRREAGAAGRDTRGMIRLHQFDKVELVSATSPQDSDCELERMLGCAEAILTGLGLHYRVVVLSTGDKSSGNNRWSAGCLTTIDG